MEEECCPPFDPIPWDGKVLEWDNKRFIRDRVMTFFFIPLNFGSVIKRMNELVEKAGATIHDWLCLSDHVSRWSMDLYLATDREIPGGDNVTLTGRFSNKVYEGPYGDTGKWCSDYEAYTRSQGLNITKWYMWYITCPKCAKKFGKNYVVVVCRVE